jgi:hypothetical protein
MDLKSELLMKLATLLKKRIEELELKELEEEIWLEEEIAKEREKIRPVEQELLPVEEQEPEKALASFEALRSDVNLLKYPIFSLDDKDVKRRTSLKCSVVIEKEGKKLEALWEVVAPKERGYPGPFDKKVHLAILEMINEMEPPIKNPITFTTHELLKRIGYKKNPGKASYKKVADSLLRLVSFTITSEGTFYIKRDKKWLTKAFHLYDEVARRGETLPGGGIADKNYIWLSQYYLDNINHGYTAPLALPFYKSVKNPIAQRLYEILSVRLYGVIRQGGQFYNIDYHNLCQLLPLTPQKIYKYAKRQLKKAHEELEDEGYLEKVEWDGWVIRYYPGERFFEEYGRSGETRSPFRLKAGVDPAKEAKIEELVREIAQRLGDGSWTRDGVCLSPPKDLAFYYHIARRVPEDIIRMCLADVEMAEMEGKIEKSKRALFTAYLKESCASRKIPLEFGSESKEEGA